jgi:hypothetical protein
MPSRARIAVSRASMASASASLGLVVPALRVQRAVHQQVGVVVCQCPVLLRGLAGDHRCAKHQVGHHQGLARVVEGQHVGGVVALAVVAVERAPLFGIHDAHGDLRIGVQRVADPAAHLPALQGLAVVGRVSQLAELQREGQRGEGRTGRHHSTLRRDGARRIGPGASRSASASSVRTCRRVS